MTEPFLFSRRTNWLLESNKLTVDLECLRNKKTPILDLTESNPTCCGFSYPQDDILKSLTEENNLSYRPAPQGDLKAREAVSQYYSEKGSTVSPEGIFLTASTSEAYSYLFRLLANPSDHVLFPRPSYPLFSFLGNLNDVRMETYPLVYDGKWNIDLKNTRHLFCDDTRVFVLVDPNNPTGSFVRRGELEELTALCRQHNTALICDEVFADFAFDGTQDRVSLLENDQVLSFVLGGVSKTLGLPQMKLSWIIINGPQDLVKKASLRLEVIADTYLSVNTPTQNALPLWLSHRKKIQEGINARIRQNYSFLKEEAKTTWDCELLATEGGWYAVLKIPDTYSEEEWALAFLNRDHVFVHPGYFFDFDNEAFIVVSLLPSEHVFQGGIKRILGRISKGEL
ncbi:MAG: pyridoxal phosphate-dependent aminotransferase [Candidatus Omnitrophica bacterium]|nr:pyridoxal phosphate-dependent aminotransferase [Candidatus Omnitrophota bacterium]MCK5259970.1 pyridoxal phosphate-dependent aminotransferase [Candidatus Omnitrophota bacterium]